MELLEFLEGIHNILILGEFLCKLTEFLLGLKILLEVKITEFAVDFYLVVEFLDIDLIGVVDIPVVLGRYRTYCPPAVLYLTEFREGGIYILILFQKSLEVRYNGLFHCKILLPLPVETCVVFRPLFLICIVKSLESILYLREGIFRVLKSIFRDSFRSICPFL